jgi:AAA+ ATPase superfamily predicted ATPase
MFYGRVSELEFLNNKYNNNKAQLVVLYGRRRVGKTELLRFFSKDKPHIFYACRECTDKEQINLFSAKLLSSSPLNGYIKSFNDWEKALTFIKDINIEGKKLVMIDEFPYMVNGNNSIPSILQNIWDEDLKNQNIMLILCGSSMSFIEKNILAEKNPLYGRTTGIYKLTELDFFTAAKFFVDNSNEDKVLFYSVLGGIPHYLNQFDSTLSLDENIKTNILSKGSILYSEVEFMMKQELRETAVYYSIIEAIALGNTKLNDIYNKTSIEKSKISVYLKNLIDLNIIEREYPVTTSLKKSISTSVGLYKIKDKYFNFYFRFLFPNLSELEAGDIDGVYKFNIKPFLNEYVSFIFEDISIQYMRTLNKHGNLHFHFSNIGRWWDKRNEIDIIAFDQNGNIIFGECKWKNSIVGIKELTALKEKSASVDGSFINRYFYLFSKSGFTDEIKALCKIDNSLKLVSLNDIGRFTDVLYHE